MIFAAAAIGTQRIDGNFYNKLIPFLVEAANFDEATGKAARVAAVMFQPKDGWGTPFIQVSTNYLTTETAVPEHAPEPSR